MDEPTQAPDVSTPSSPVGPITPQPQPAAPHGLDVSKLFLPGAIVFAALLISGAVIYTNLSKAQLAQGTQDTSTVLNADNLKKWAKSLKLNMSQFNQCFEGLKYKAEIAKDEQDGVIAGVEGTPTFFINGTKIVGAVPFDQFKQAIDLALQNKNVKEKVQPLVDDDPVLGDANAPVTIIEFSDFQCPYCRKFQQETLPQIQSQYIDTGKLKLVYRDFPLSFHPGAEPGAEAANCASEQGKYWEMHDMIFEKQI